MPKVVVTEAGKDQVTADPATWSSRYVRVGWSKDEDVLQVATCLVASDLSEQVGASRVPGLLVSLDRDGVNRLIKGLRDARDQLYGADQ